MGSESGNFDEDRFQLGLLNAGTQVDLTARLPEWSTLAPLLEVVDSSGNAVADTNPLMESSPVRSPSTVPTSPAFVRQEQSLTAACTRTTQPARAGPLLKPQQ